MFDSNRLLIVAMCLSLIIYVFIDMSRTYVYDFVIKQPHYVGMMGLNIIEIKADGKPLKKGSVTHYQKTEEGLAYYMYDGDPETFASYRVRLQPGDKFLTVKMNRRPRKFSITYLRPNYAPAWTILENGKEIIKENNNRGNAMTPSPVTYDYVLP